jgi:hypothetical protein
MSLTWLSRFRRRRCGKCVAAVLALLAGCCIGLAIRFG